MCIEKTGTTHNIFIRGTFSAVTISPCSYSFHGHYNIWYYVMNVCPFVCLSQLSTHWHVPVFLSVSLTAGGAIGSPYLTILAAQRLALCIASLSLCLDISSSSVRLLSLCFGTSVSSRISDHERLIGLLVMYFIRAGWFLMFRCLALVVIRSLDCSMQYIWYLQHIGLNDLAE